MYRTYADSLKTALDIFDHERCLSYLRVANHANLEDDTAKIRPIDCETCEFLSPPSPPDTLPLPEPDEA